MHDDQLFELEHNEVPQQEAKNRARAELIKHLDLRSEPDNDWKEASMAMLNEWYHWQQRKLASHHMQLFHYLQTWWLPQPPI
jgi:hypothetical protein